MAHSIDSNIPFGSLQTYCELSGPYKIVVKVPEISLLVLDSQLSKTSSKASNGGIYWNNIWQKLYRSIKQSQGSTMVH